MVYRLKRAKINFNFCNFLIQIELNEDKITTFKNIEKIVLHYSTNKDVGILVKQYNKLVIICKNEDYEFLSKRLLRYQNFCKITCPEEFKNYFTDYIDKILNIYK